MEKIRSLLVLLAVFMVSFNAMSWNITGTVMDENKERIEYATLHLLKNDSLVTAVHTDSIGQFAIKVDTTGIFLLKISALGFNPESKIVRVDAANCELGNITLSTSSRELKEVTVTARNIQRVDDHLQIIPDKISVKHSASGFQLLQNIMLPGVSVDTWSGAVSLFGKGVSLYVDGEPADAKIIRNIKPKDVEKIEFHDVPSGRYAGQYAVINFITSQPRSGGYVTLDMAEKVGYYNGDYNGFAKVAKDNVSFYTYLGYGSGYTGFTESRTNQRFDLTSGTVGRENLNHSRGRSTPAYGQFRTVYRTPKTILSGTFALVGSKSRSEESSVMSYYEPYSATEDMRNRTNNRSLSPSVSLSGQFALPNNQYFNAYLTGSYAHNNRDYIYTSASDALQSRTKEDFYNVNTQLTYGKNLKNRNVLSVHLANSYRNTDALYRGDYPSRQQLWSNEALLFIQYAQVLGKATLFVRPGVSMLSSKLYGNSSRVKYNPRLYLQGNYRVGQNQMLTVTGSVGNSFPSIDRMSSAEQPIDEFQISRGNPYLRNAVIYTASFRYSGQFNKVNIYLNTEYGYTHNTSLSDYTIENDKLVRSFLNGINEGVNVNLGATWNVCKNLRLSFPLQYYFFKKSAGIKRLSNVPVAAVEGMVFWKEFSLNFWAKNQAKYLTGSMTYSRDPSSYGFNLSWNHRNWNLQCRATHPFGRAKYKSWITIDNVYDMHQIAWEKKSISFKVSYTFDFGKKTQRDSQLEDVNRNIDSGILK